jgi:ZIP family zinc transporter
LVSTRVAANSLATKFAGILLGVGKEHHAGRALLVIVDEIISDIAQKSLGQSGTLGVIVGCVTMFWDVALG